MTASPASPADILSFWWKAGEAKWFAPDAALDREITERFLPAYEAAGRGELDGWAEDAGGCLALIILLDQFSRNMFRHDARAYAQDGRARAFARHALDSHYDRLFPGTARQFFYMPFMHSEDIADQTLSVDLFRQSGSRDNYFYALVHMDAIRRFGRFPHRNRVLGRPSSEAEEAYLASGGFSA